MKKSFEEKMDTLSTEEIIDVLRMTWFEPEGGIFREVGFDILWDRLGEEASDEIYDKLWYEMHGKAE